VTRAPDAPRTGAAGQPHAVDPPCVNLNPPQRNEHLPKDFKGPQKVPNYTADQPLDAWIESYEVAMEMLDVNDAVRVRQIFHHDVRWVGSLLAKGIAS